MRTPIAHPLPILGTILVHKSDGSTCLLPASSECFDPYEINAIRNLVALDPIEGEPESLTLARMQKEDVRSSVAIRSTPGFMLCGYENVEIESKDERIVRLEKSEVANMKYIEITATMVGHVLNAEKLQALRDDVIRVIAALEKTGTGGMVVSPKGCEVVR